MYDNVHPTVGLNDDQRPTSNTELAVDVLEMFLYGVLNNTEVLRYLFIGHSLQKKLHNLSLPGGAQTRNVGRIQVGAVVTRRHFAAVERDRVMLAPISPTTLGASALDEQPSSVR